MRHVELVAFENDSILHQKALSLPVGKVSLRQLGILVVGILTVFSAYAITDNIIVPGILFAIFLGIGLPNTKIMTPDQMIKSVIMFLIRGTSLSKKPEYMQKDKKLKPSSKEQKDNQNSYIQRSEIQSTNNIMSKIISQLESLYKKKESTESKQDQNIVTTNNDKNYSVKVELTPENMLNITPIKTMRNKSQENNSIDKLLNSLTTSKNNLHDQKDSDFLQEHMSILLDDKKLESDKMISNNNSMISILLNKNSKYDIQTIVNE